MRSAWVEEESDWQLQREEFRAQYQGGRRRPVTYPYPEHLAGSFPSFGSWLNSHVRTLRNEGFPVSAELIELHCPPSHIALSFKAMWAFGCHYRCNPESEESFVSFDSGVASVSPDASTIDVGIVKEILLITYGKVNCVVLQADWIKSTEQGRAAIKKDRLGFWSVLFNARDRGPRLNPYVFPASISQVYFMDDGVHEGWKVVLRHDPRSRRVTEDKETLEFDSAGECFPPPNGGAASENEFPPSAASNPVEEAPLGTEYVQVVDEHHGLINEDDFLDDADYEDEIALQYVE